MTGLEYLLAVSGFLVLLLAFPIVDKVMDWLGMPK